MYRDQSIEEIYDGKFYGLNDLAKIGCDGCRGCSACCRGMGNSIVLDPLDVHRLAAGLLCTPAALLQEHEETQPESGTRIISPVRMELGVVDGLILPSLKLDGADESCTFLNGEGRCSVHSIRPGVCRLFPLGRFYDGNGDYTYIVQAGECPYPVKTKVKIKKWIDTPDYERYHRFVLMWHAFQKEMQIRMAELEAEAAKALCIQILQVFYLTPYSAKGFFEEFERRLNEFHV
jgi:Fe-S-cluster containining protein